METPNNYSLLYDIKNVIKLILTTISNDLNADSTSIMMIDSSKNELVILESLGLSLDSVLNIKFKLNEGLAGLCYNNKTPLLINNTSEDSNFKNFNFQREDISSIVVYPVIDKTIDKVCAILNFSSSKINNFNESCLIYLDNYASLILNTLKNFQKSNDDIPLNFIDNNTGLYNCAFFLENIKREIDRAERYNDTFSLIFIKIDKFDDIIKKYDDDFVKKIIQDFAFFLKKTSRKVDICSTYDFTSFTIITPETSKSGALIKVERIQENILKGRHLPNCSIDYPDLNIKYAVSGYPEDGLSSDELINHCLSQF